MNLHSEFVIGFWWVFDICNETKYHTSHKPHKMWNNLFHSLHRDMPFFDAIPKYRSDLKSKLFKAKSS